MKSDITSKTIDGITDLVVWAPIKEGFIDAFENITYESRLRIVAEALHNVRQSAREHSLISPFADTAERILSLLDFRIGIVDRDLHEFEMSSHDAESVIKPRKYMYLVATFDGPWEPYMRLIWEPLGDFLDLILCNCDGYVPAGDSSFEDYAEWVRTHQLDSAIFYSTSGLTVKDKLYLTELEKLQREINGKDFDIQAAQLVSEDPEIVANGVKTKDKYNSNRLALEALNVLYRLADYYPPDRMGAQGDGRYLLRASKKLLHGWDTEKIFSTDPTVNEDPIKRTIAAHVRDVYGEPLSWFELKLPDSKRPIQTDPHADNTEVQKGLLTSYDEGRDEPVTHGALLLLQITNIRKAADFIRNFTLSWEPKCIKETPSIPEEFEGMLSGVFRNLAFTYQGLERLGLSQEELRAFPKEFRQGMEQRAPILGDIRNNHPRRWKLPKRWVDPSWIQEDHNASLLRFFPNLALTENDIKSAPPVELTEVDLVIQLRGDDSSDKFSDMSERVAKRARLESKPKLFPLSLDNQLLGTGNEDPLLSLLKDHQGELVFSKINEKGGSKAFSNNDKINKLYDKVILSGQDSTTVATAFKSSLQDYKDLKYLIETFSDLEEFILYLHKNKIDIGLSILAIEPMFRDFSNEVTEESKKPAGFSLPDDLKVNRDHFGFLDGISQPKIKYNHDDNDYKLNEVRRGDILIGYKNTRGDYPSRYAANPRENLQFNGSFLALRKMSQDAEAFHELCKSQDGEEIAAQMVGRQKTGRPLIEKTKNWDPENDPQWESENHNNFDYTEDIDGEQCPFGSHIRRTNPRLLRQGNRPPTPMILRRGMTYGHRYKRKAKGKELETAGPDAERGVMFMAYCANLAEQYETIQRWVNGGNSTNTFSDHKDPLVGPLPKNGKNIFRYIDKDKKVKRYEIKKPFTTLEWGTYLFVPSFTAIQKICEPRIPESPTCPYLGKKVVEKIESYPVPVQQMEWKVLLEDYLTKDPSERATSPDVWAAIRDNGGVHKIKSGVKGRTEGESHQDVLLVADESLITNVLSDHESFSVSEQGRRVEECFAPIYVARDPGDIYDAEATDANRILFEYEEKTAYDLAYEVASSLLYERKEGAEKTAMMNGIDYEIKLELRREFIRPVLAEICKRWYGIPDEDIIKKGGWGWDGLNGTEPLCPGDFMAPSRHTFYPRPTQAISNYAIAHGKSLKIATAKIVEQGFDDTDNQEATLEGVIAQDMMTAIKRGQGSLEEKKDLLVRNIIGTMTGALPPMDGNLRSIFFEWIKEDSLWRYQGALQRITYGVDSSYEEANEALRKPIMEAMCKRPAPDLIYRTATKTGTLGSGKVKYEEGDLIILNLVSATQCRLENRNDDLNVDMVFGGKRHGAKQAEGHPMHACPAYKMAMGAMLGIVAALMDSGRIQALPASLIIRINEWQPLLPLKD